MKRKKLLKKSFEIVKLKPNKSTNISFLISSFNELKKLLRMDRFQFVIDFQKVTSVYLIDWLDLSQKSIIFSFKLFIFS